MNAENYLKSLIEDKSDYMLTDEDTKTIQFEGIQKFIYNKLNSSKFRATKTSESYDNTVKEKIALCIANNAPIHIDLSTGATKNPNVPTAPGIDWAEVFNIALVRQFLKPIAAAYKPGVSLDYFSVAIFEEKVNHISQKDVALYDSQFTELIRYYQNYLPKNFTLQFRRLSDTATKELLYPIIDAEIEKLKKEWPLLPEETKKEKLMRAERNIKFSGEEENRNEIILRAALAHDAFCNECWTTKAKPIWHEKDDISLGHRYTNGWAIHIKSSQASTVNFWSGTGVLINKENNYITNILSPKQYAELAPRIKEETIDLFSNNQILAQKLAKVGVYTLI